MSYSTCPTSKFPVFNVFRQFLTFGKIQDGAQNGGHLEWRHRPRTARQPIMCTSSCRAHHRLTTKGEIFSKYCNITKTRGGSINPPPQFVPRWGRDFACTSEGQHPVLQFISHGQLPCLMLSNPWLRGIEEQSLDFSKKKALARNKVPRPSKGSGN